VSSITALATGQAGALLAYSEEAETITEEEDIKDGKKKDKKD
jgi:hypothetical protein